MKKILLSVFVAAMFATNLWAIDETMNPLITAMPSLSIAPDALSAGMGDLGVATHAGFDCFHAERRWSYRELPSLVAQIRC